MQAWLGDHHDLLGDWAIGDGCDIHDEHEMKNL